MHVGVDPIDLLSQHICMNEYITSVPNDDMGFTLDDRAQGISAPGQGNR